MGEKRLKKGMLAMFFLAFVALIAPEKAYAEADYTNPVLPIQSAGYEQDTETLYLGDQAAVQSEGEMELHGAAAAVHWSNSKKGLQENEYLLDPDYQALGVKHVLINLVVSNCVTYTNGEYHLTSTSDAIAYQPLVQKLNAEGVKVTAVILYRWTGDANLKKLIYPSARTSGYQYYNLNCEDAVGQKAWGTIFRELVSNYGQADCHVDNWILGNEVNQYGKDCYNYTGSNDLTTNVKAYTNVFKVFNQAVADKYPSAKTYISFDHNWTGTDTGHQSRKYLDLFASYMGSGQWGVAWHPYAPCLNSAENTNWANKVIWNSPGVTNSVESRYVCGSNLQVLTNYIKGKWGASHRVLLSEQGYDAKGSLPYQSAFIAYTYYAAQYNSMIDGVMFRSYLDQPAEMGLKFGLINGNWDTMSAAADKASYVAANKRPSYDVFKYMDTNDAGSYTSGCLKSIGINYWTDVIANYSGPSPVGLWKKEGNTWYLYRGETRVTGWVQYKGAWYYMNPEKQGAMATGWYMANGRWYYANGAGVMQTGGWKKLGGKWYYLESSGAAKTGWLKLKGKWYFMDRTSAAMRTGWYQDGKTWYYANGNGEMQTGGWKKLGGKWYYLQSSGAAKTGWLKLKGKWYFMDRTSAAMRTGWYQDGKTWYYANGSGEMQTGGWKKLRGKWYYLQSSGAAKTGWLKSNGKWYFMDYTSTAMRTGWYQDGETWYYSNGSGVMQSGGWKKIGRAWYYLKNSGAMQTGWLKTGGKWYYLDAKNGNMITGRLELDHMLYSFNSSGALVSSTPLETAEQKTTSTPAAIQIPTPTQKPLTPTESVQEPTAAPTESVQEPTTTPAENIQEPTEEPVEKQQEPTVNQQFGIQESNLSTPVPAKTAVEENRK